jgi:hypothetical protein
MIEQGIVGTGGAGGMMAGGAAGGGAAGLMVGNEGMMGDDGAGVGSLLDPTDRTALEMRMDGTLVTADGMEAGVVDRSVAMLAGHVMHDTTVNPLGDMAGLDELAMLDGLEVPGGSSVPGGGAVDEVDELDMLDIPGGDPV